MAKKYLCTNKGNIESEAFNQSNVNAWVQQVATKHFGGTVSTISHRNSMSYFRKTGATFCSRILPNMIVSNFGPIYMNALIDVLITSRGVWMLYSEARAEVTSAIAPSRPRNPYAKRSKQKTTSSFAFFKCTETNASRNQHPHECDRP